MRFKLYLLPYSILLLFFLNGFASSYGQQQHPPSLNWKKIKTDNITIVFPQELSDKACKTAILMDSIMGPVSLSLETKTRNINLFLFNQSVVSNGYVALAPRHMAWYTTPPQNNITIGGGNWFSLLGNHEYRHVAQLSKQNENFTFFLSHFFGQYAQVFLNTWSVPLWFNEGDAISTETAYTNMGRGRIPAFNMGIRTILLNDQKFSYDKAYLGSFKHYIPNFYQLGYLMAGHIRKNNEVYKTSDVLEQVTKRSVSPFSFARSLKVHTGYNLRHTYRNAMEEADSTWRKWQNERSFDTTSYRNTAGKRSWTNYYDPLFTGDGDIIARKYGMDDHTHLVIINEKGEETKLFNIPGSVKTSYSKNKIAWAQTIYDPRWNERSYSDIFIYDVKSREKTRLTSKQKYFVPSLSPDGKTIAAVEYTPQLSCNLVIINAQTGEQIFRYPFPEDDFIRTPSWNPDGNLIVFAHTKNDEMGISVLDIKHKQHKNILPYNIFNISRPVFYKNYILYNSSEPRIGAIYAIDTATRQKYKVFAGEYGSYNPVVDYNKNLMAFQDYGLMGYSIGVKKLAPQSWETAGNKKEMQYLYADAITRQEHQIKAENKTNGDEEIKSMEIKNYYPLLHILNIHSWSVLPSYQGVIAQIYSNDKLHTTALSGGYDYNTNEKKGYTFFSVKYSGIYPEFDANIISGYRTSTYNDYGNSSINYYHWRENTFDIGVAIPLMFNDGVYSNNLFPRVAYEYTHIYDFGPPFSPALNSKLNSLSYELNYRRAGQSAIRDIHPPFAQNIRCVYKHTPFNGSVQSSLFSSYAKLFFPGLFNHHSLQLSGVYEDQGPLYAQWQNYHYPSEHEFFRGYDFVFHHKLYKFSIDYAFPLLYPDIPIWSFLYFKRVRTNVFYDNGRGANAMGTAEYYQSMGADLVFDLHILRVPFALDMGVRFSHQLTNNINRIELLILGMAL